MAHDDAKRSDQTAGTTDEAAAREAHSAKASAAGEAEGGAQGAPSGSETTAEGAATQAAREAAEAAEAEREARLEERMSYADLQRRHAHPKYVALAVVALLAAIVAPYAWGRWLAMNRTGELVSFLQSLDPRGIAFVSWSVTAFALMSVAMMFLGRRRWAWTAVFTVLLACEQFIAGFCLLKWDFAYSTNVVYGQAAMGANAANVGIIAAMIALCVFVVLFVLILVVIRKDSPLNVLTQDWAGLIMYWAVEAAALAVVLAMFSRVA